MADLSPIESLTGIQSLKLSGTDVQDLSPLSGLADLQDLDVAGANISDLGPLAGLRKLRDLRLSSKSVEDLSPLAGLLNLSNLDISFTSVRDLSPLENLRNLRILDLGGTGVEDLSPLARLHQLKKLELAGTSIEDLSPLVGLQRLQSLSCGFKFARQLLERSSHKLGQITDLTPLATLKDLRLLEVRGCRGVTDFSPLSGLQKLQSLNLSSAGVTDLSPLAGLHELRVLNLSLCTGVKDLSFLANLQKLQVLDLYHCRPTVTAELLRTLSNHTCLTKIVADEIAGIPLEILSRSGGDNCFSRLRSYACELALGAAAENEVKVVLLGNGRVGKTQLCRRFRGQSFDDSVSSTHGVHIWREERRIRAGGEEQIFQVNWWDFGGQDIYHGTHALFLQSRAIFLILWTPSLENRNEYLDDNGIPLRNQPINYWIDYVRSLSGRESPVIVVQSQCDEYKDRRPRSAETGGAGLLRKFALTARKRKIEDERFSKVSYAMRLNTYWVGQALLRLGRDAPRSAAGFTNGGPSGTQAFPSEELAASTLTLEEFHTLCDETRRSFLGHALDDFHQTGVVFYQKDLFPQKISSRSSCGSRCQSIPFQPEPSQSLG